MPSTNVIEAKLSPFGHMLRDWRNTRGVSQLGLGIDAGVSARHISFLETGRAQPSRGMVLTLADALDMPLRARNTLLETAGFAPVYGGRSLDDPDMTAARLAVDTILAAHEPYSCFVIDGLWNLLELNKGAEKMLAFLGVPFQPGQTNMAHLTCAPGPLRDMTENWREVVEHFVARLGHEARHGPNREGAVQLLQEISNVEGCDDLQYRPDFEPDPLLQMQLKVGEATLNMISTITTLGTPQDVTLSELRIETFLPADQATADILKVLLSD